MTLRLKIHLIVGVLTLLFVGAVLGLQWRALHDSVNEEVAAANRVAAQLLNRVVWRQAAEGPNAMLAYLQGVGRVRSNDITLFDAAGELLYQSPPSPYKAGRDAPQWFAGLMAPPAVEQAFEFPGGRLVVRSNASRAVLDAWDSFVVLLGSGVVMLAALNGLLFVLVGNTVRPFKQIVSALNQLEGGRFDVTLPALPGREAGAIGAAFNRMTGVLRDHIETEKRAVRAERELSDNRELGRWIDHHIEQERKLIARELHDELGQSVTAIRSLALSIAQRTQGVDASAEGAARMVADEASRLYDAMHGMIPRLAPLVLDRFGLAAALADLVERTRRSQPGVVIELDTALASTRLAPDAALALYRAAQEGITNALRHGKARHIRIGLQLDGGQALLRLADDGVGLPAEGTDRSGHHGLRWLAERVHALDGRFDIGPASPQGVLLRVAVPVMTEATA